MVAAGAGHFGRAWPQDRVEVEKTNALSMVTMWSPTNWSCNKVLVSLGAPLAQLDRATAF